MTSPLPKNNPPTSSSKQSNREKVALKNTCCESVIDTFKKAFKEGEPIVIPCFLNKSGR